MNRTSLLVKPAPFAVLVAVALAANAAPPRGLTSEQAAYVEKTAVQAEQACLHSEATLQGVKQSAVRTMLQWLGDPRICACQAQMIRDATTPAVFSMSGPEVRQYYFDATLNKGADCIVPVMKEKFASSCEQLFSDMEDQKAWPDSARKKLNDAGYADPHALVVSICTCIKPVVSNISTKDWIDSSKAAFNAYRERQRTGNKDIKNPPGPFDAAIGRCMPQFPQKDSEPANAPESQVLPK